jgi:hypothetical protein
VAWYRALYAPRAGGAPNGSSCPPNTGRGIRGVCWAPLLGVVGRLLGGVLGTPCGIGRLARDLDDPTVLLGRSATLR